MSTYYFKDNTGQTRRVDAEPGISEADAYARFQKWQDSGGAVPPRSAEPEDPTYGMNPVQLATANLGAGMTNLMQGVRGWLPGDHSKPLTLPGPFGDITIPAANSQDVMNKRQLDEQLAGTIPGGKAWQVGGEILPTLAIPAGAFARGAVGAANLVRGANAVRPLVGLTAAAVDAGGAGALLGAMQPITDDESRTVNTLIGGATGALMPGLMKAAGMGIGYFTRAAAQSKAAQLIIDRLGGPERAREVLLQAQGQGFGPAATRDIPLSTAEVTQSAPLAAMQIGSKAQFPDQWTNFVGTQAQKRFENLQGIIGDADTDLAAADTAREAATTPMREAALGRASEDPWFTQGLVGDLSRMRTKLGKSSPSMTQVMDYVQSNLENGITPSQLYRVHKELTARLNGPITDDLSAAVKANKVDVYSLVKSIDSTLDAATNGTWSRYMQKFASKSGEVNDAGARAEMNQWFNREGAPQLAGVPQVTGTNLGKAIDRFNEGDFGGKFSDDTMSRLLDLRQNLDQTEGLQKLLRFSGTSGGGSNTTMDLGEVAKLPEFAKSIADKVPFVESIRKGSMVRTQAAIRDALMNPDQFIAGVSAQLQRGAPLSPTQDVVMRFLRAGSTQSVPLALEASGLNQ
jgi:hypothetical protein